MTPPLVLTESEVREIVAQALAPLPWPASGCC